MDARRDAPGGLRVTLAFAGAFVAVGLVYLGVFVVPPLITVFTDDLGLSHSESGLLMSIYLIAYALTSFTSGPLADRFGAAQVMFAGTVIVGLSSLLFMATTSLGVFLVARFGVGIGTALVYAPGITFAARLLPPRRMTTGIGLYLSGLSAGVTLAFLITPLLEDALSWRWPFVVAGIACVLGAVVFAVLAFPLSRPAPAPTSDTRAVDLGSLLRNVPFLKVSLGLFASMFVAYGVFTWVPPYLDESAGLSTGQLSLALTLAVALGIPATLLAGWLADRTGRPVLVASVGMGMAATLLVLAALDDISFGLAMAMTVIATAGVTGGLIPLFALPAATVDPSGAARATGLATSFAMAGAIVSTYLGGALVGATDGYGLPFVVYVAMTAVAVLLLLPLAAQALARLRRPAAA